MLDTTLIERRLADHIHHTCGHCEVCDLRALLDEVARLREVVEQCIEAMEQTYEVSDYPANGKSPCDHAIKAARARLNTTAMEHTTA